MRFWDSSALVPLLVAEAATPWATASFDADPDLIAWWGTSVECVSALSRLEREDLLAPAGTSDALRRLSALRDAWAEVQPSERIRSSAVRLLRTHRLRSADALQLAAALAAAEDHPATLPFVTLDIRLAAAADREGFDAVAPA